MADDDRRRTEMVQAKGRLLPAGRAGAEQLVLEYKRTRDRTIRNHALDAFFPLADLYAQRFARPNAAVEDLRQVALLAILRAMERFDPEVGVQFSTFAGRTIEGELKRYHRDRSWCIRPPRRLQERYLELKQAEERLTHVRGRSPTVEELAAAVGESVERVIEALEVSGAYRAHSFDEPVEDAHGSVRTIHAPPGQIDGRYEQAEVRVVLRDLLRSLPDRERAVIRLMFFEDWTQDAIAEELGISQSYLSRIVRRTLGKLRQRLDRGSTQCA